jgi:hypothetical protein
MGVSFAKYRVLRGILGIWRKGWDSNPRYPCRHAGFQDRCLKPLGHPSVTSDINHPVEGISRKSWLARNWRPQRPIVTKRTRKAQVQTASSHIAVLSYLAGGSFIGT